MNRAEKLNEILENFRASSSDIEACAMVSEDGLMIASLLPEGIEEGQVAAMSAAMMAMGARTAAELKRGSLQQLYVKGENGYVIGMYIGQYGLLLAMTRKEAKLGLILLELSRAVKEISDALA